MEVTIVWLPRSIGCDADRNRMNAAALSLVDALEKLASLKARGPTDRYEAVQQKAKLLAQGLNVWDVVQQI